MSEFSPPPGLRSAHAQSLLNSSGIRRRFALRRAAGLQAAEEELIMDGGDDVRLVAHLSRQPSGSRGTVVLLHGWEGSSNSNYILTTGAHLFEAGFDVFRLNFRDHGPTHHLNRGIFHSCRIDEVLHALGDMQERTGARSWDLAGFSLGGNFALRVAARGPGLGLAIGRVFAVCPVIDPANVLRAMESAPRFYEHYYIKKWTRSVRAKQRCFPDHYAYEEWYGLGGLRERTEYFATRYYDFASLEAYLDGYSVAGDRLAELAVPTTLLTSEDDPVIPVSDARGLAKNENLELRITRHGGHCGYLENWKLESWAEKLITSSFLSAIESGMTELKEQWA